MEEVKHSIDSRIINVRNIQRERYMRWKKDRDDEHAAQQSEAKWCDDLKARGFSAQDQEFLLEIRKENLQMRTDAIDLTMPSTPPQFIVKVQTTCGKTLRIDVQSMWTRWIDDEDGLDYTGIIEIPTTDVQRRSPRSAQNPFILQQSDIEKTRRVYDLFRDDIEIVPISCRLCLIVSQETVEQLEAKKNLAKRQKSTWSEDDTLSSVGDFRVALPKDVERNILHNVDLPIVFVEIVIKKHWNNIEFFETYYAYPANPDVNAPDDHIVLSASLKKLVNNAPTVRIRLVDLPKPPPSAKVCADIFIKSGEPGAPEDATCMTRLLQKQRLLFTNQVIVNPTTLTEYHILRLHSSTGKRARAVNIFGNVDIGIMPHDSTEI